MGVEGVPGDAGKRVLSRPVGLGGGPWGAEDGKRGRALAKNWPQRAGAGQRPLKEGAGSKAPEGSAEPGSLEILVGLALDQRLLKAAVTLRLSKAGAGSKALEGSAAPGRLEDPAMTEALHSFLPQPRPDPNIFLKIIILIIDNWLLTQLTLKSPACMGWLGRAQPHRRKA